MFIKSCYCFDIVPTGPCCLELLVLTVHSYNSSCHDTIDLALLYRPPCSGSESLHEFYRFLESCSPFCKNINECWSTWHSTFLQIMEECIPRRQLPAKQNHPWFNSSIARVARKRNYFHRRATKSQSDAHWKSYRFWRNRVTSEIRTSKRKYFDIHLNGTCRKHYWQAVKYLRGEKSSIPSLKVDGVNVISDIDKANALNEFFSECFNSTLPPLNNDDWNNIRINQDECPTDILCSEDEVLGMLCSLNTRKSNGPDGTSARMLKSCAGSISLSIKMISNHSIRSGQCLDRKKCHPNSKVNGKWNT